MTDISWFNKKSVRKQKIQLRRKPTTRRGPSPKYSPIQHIHRAPKIEKPRVDMPFVKSPSYSFLDIKARDFAKDMSVSELKSIEAGGNTITKILWHSGGGCLTCDEMGASGEWTSLEDFLGSRGSTSFRGKEVGIYSFTHPECTCHLEVFYTTADGSEEIRNVGPYA